MRDIEDIMKNPKLRNIKKAEDGFMSDIHIGGWDGSLICSWQGGWEHVSVAPYVKRIMPDWDVMCQLKEMFFKDDEAVIQVHPPKADYVNNVANCLHLWRCYYTPMVLPPSVFVGIRKGQTNAEFEQEVRDAFALAGEKYE